MKLAEKERSFGCRTASDLDHGLSTKCMKAEACNQVLIKVLLVDDDLGFLKAAKQCLEIQREIVIETASSVQKAWEKLKKQHFHAIISDILMPRKDGLQFLKELRDESIDIPFIVFTVKDKAEVATKAADLGANYFLEKSGNPERIYKELITVIERLVHTT